MINDIIFSFRGNNVLSTLVAEERVVFAELAKSIALSDNCSKELVLNGFFSKESIIYVLEHLGIEKEPEIIVFPNSKLTTIKFN